MKTGRPVFHTFINRFGGFNGAISLNVFGTSCFAVGQSEEIVSVLIATSEDEELTLSFVFVEEIPLR